MNPIKNCSTCAWCTEKNFEDQDGICSEPHAPRNAKGQITSRTHLSTAACRHYIPAAQPMTMVSTPEQKPKRNRRNRTEEMLL